VGKLLPLILSYDDCLRVIFTGSVDVWDPKVLRGAMGGHFCTSILYSLPWEDIVNHISSSSHICIASSLKRAAVEKSFDVMHPKVQQLLEEAEEEDAEEEGGEVQKGERRESLMREEMKSGEVGSDVDCDAESDDNDDDHGLYSKRKSQAYKRVPLSVVPYHDLDCQQAEEVTVIIGGETAGISDQAKKFAFERFGQFVTIPMVGAVDSLNSATAAAIVIYEARRQLEDARRRRRERTASAKMPRAA
jgi:hypothetical protein